MDEAEARALADVILLARAEHRVLDPQVAAALGHDDAYRVQDLLTQARLAAGARRAGWKLGYTSAAMRAQMGIDQPNLGPLTDAMILGTGAVVGTEVTQPRVEPEIAAVIGADVPPGADGDRLRACVSGWQAALEVVDSVWADYRFDWAMNTADGSSAALVVLGAEITGADLAGAVVELRRNGEVVASGHGSAAMGDPWAALAWLVGQLDRRGENLHAGDVVITGGLTRAVPFEPGDRVEATIAGAEVAAERARS